MLNAAMIDGQYLRITIVPKNSDGDVVPATLTWTPPDASQAEIDVDASTLSCLVHALRPTGSNPAVVRWTDNAGYTDSCEIAISTDPVVASWNPTVSAPTSSPV